MSCVVVVELVMSGNTQVDVDLKLCSFVVREDTNCQLKIGLSFYIELS